MGTVPELSILKVISNYLQSIDRAVCELITKSYLGDVNAEVSVQYPARFDLKSSAEMLKEVTDLAAAEKNGFTISSPTATGEIYMQVINALLPDVDDETYDKIEAEVKAAVEAMVGKRTAESEKPNVESVLKESTEVPPNPSAETSTVA